MNRNKHIDIDGVFLLDKPMGITSNKALQQVKHLFKAKKAGHTGNLDPLASGVLPICLGEATKFAGYLLNADKTYNVTANLGATTDTGDADGKIIATAVVPTLSAEYLRQILKTFCGEIQQLPPMYSALKHQGQPLYKLARKGIEVERDRRAVTIHTIELLELQQESVSLRVHCSKGTYIRTLMEDIGNALGCGAHVIALRRTQVGHYLVEDTITIEALQTHLLDEQGAANDLLLPVDSALTDYPEIIISDFAAVCLVKGQQIATRNAPSYGLVRLKTENNAKFLGLGEAIGGGMISPKRLISATK